MFDQIVRFFFKKNLDSTNLKWMAWHSLNGGTLAVEFQHGGVYAYTGVPRSEYRYLAAVHNGGGSVGSAFHHSIKLGGFDYARVS